MPNYRNEIKSFKQYIYVYMSTYIHIYTYFYKHHFQKSWYIFKS